MTTPAAIRQATPRDAFAVAALHLQRARELGAPADPGFLDRFADVWLREQAQRPYWLAEIENRPLGGCGLHVITELPEPGLAQPRRWAHGSFVFVTPTFRRCGIGGQLVRRAAAWASAEGLGRVVADVEPLGAAAPGIARRLGHGGRPVEHRPAVVR